MDGLHVPCFSAKRYTLYGESRKEDEMPILVFFMLLFIGMALVWVVAAGLLLGTVISGIPGALDKMLDYKGKHCVCHLPFMHQT